MTRALLARDMALLDFYGEFARTQHACGTCRWTGLGSEMATGETFGHGVDMECPRCAERWGFVQYSVVVSDDAPADWKANIGRIAD